ncbi:protein-tyrosine phosphatase [Curtobacterium flaccumfaciens]|uniref:protein-tyrosine-phosphatase n=1 Tax=Curtobacterium flaccumfaciens TaxID=2035 RepID=A0A4R6DHG9_9MICO|nr:low molecular weight phosphatase family protein [Curtobacterium flaccumfaciens]TDN44023.1 protein-tyrosine phosphatase [Curtobacterium flaccumfaciens]
MTPRSILFVCEGNICRSPYAVAAFAERWRTLPGARPAHVSSAGTKAPAGAAAHERLSDLVRTAGARDGLTAHRARPIETAALRGQHLVLTMERRQRGDVLDLAPAVLRRTFTLLELDRLAGPLLDSWDGDTVRAGDTVHELLARQRAVTGNPGGGVDDLADPVRGAAAEFRAMADRIDSAIDSLVALLVRFDDATRGGAL